MARRHVGEGDAQAPEAGEIAGHILADRRFGPVEGRFAGEPDRARAVGQQGGQLPFVTVRGQIGHRPVVSPVPRMPAVDGRAAQRNPHLLLHVFGIGGRARDLRGQCHHGQQIHVIAVFDPQRVERVVGLQRVILHAAGQPRLGQSGEEPRGDIPGILRGVPRSVAHSVDAQGAAGKFRRHRPGQFRRALPHQREKLGAGEGGDGVGPVGDAPREIRVGHRDAVGFEVEDQPAAARARGKARDLPHVVQHPVPVGLLPGKIRAQLPDKKLGVQVNVQPRLLRPGNVGLAVAQLVDRRKIGRIVRPAVEDLFGSLRSGQADRVEAEIFQPHVGLRGARGGIGPVVGVVLRHLRRGGSGRPFGERREARVRVPPENGLRPGVPRRRNRPDQQNSGHPAALADGENPAGWTCGSGLFHTG